MCHRFGDRCPHSQVGVNVITNDEILQRFADTFEREFAPADEIEALATLFTWIGRRNQSCLWKQALAAQLLVSIHGSNAKAGKSVGISGEQIRQRTCLLELPPIVKMMLA